MLGQDLYLLGARDRSGARIESWHADAPSTLNATSISIRFQNASDTALMVKRIVMKGFASGNLCQSLTVRIEEFIGGLGSVRSFLHIKEPAVAQQLSSDFINETLNDVVLLGGEDLVFQVAFSAASAGNSLRASASGIIMPRGSIGRATAALVFT